VAESTRVVFWAAREGQPVLHALMRGLISSPVLTGNKFLAESVLATPTHVCRPKFLTMLGNGGPFLR